MRLTLRRHAMVRTAPKSSDHWAVKVKSKRPSKVDAKQVPAAPDQNLMRR
jgi:hypothetical protein